MLHMFIYLEMTNNVNHSAPNTVFQRRALILKDTLRDCSIEGSTDIRINSTCLCGCSGLLGKLSSPVCKYIIELVHAAAFFDLHMINR